MNKNLKETKETNNKKVKVKFPEVQSEGLLQIKEQANKRKSPGFYSDKTDNELLKYCEEYCKKNNITKRNQLISNNISLYNALRKREFLNSVFGILEKKPLGFYSDKTDKELIELSRNICNEYNIKKRTELEIKNKTLYSLMLKRNLLDSVFGQNESKPRGYYSNMSDDELIDYGKNYCEVNKIIIRKTLKNTNLGLYDVLNKRNLLNSVGLNKNNGDWISMSDVELIEYGKDFCNKHDLSLRKNLRKKSESLYHVLCRRKLLDSVFSEQSHLNDLVDAIRNFGAGENE